MIPVLHPFDASGLKLERAALHIADMETQVSEFLASKPFEATVEQPEELKVLDTFAWVVRIRQPTPLRFAGIIGDAVHNLRSALDLMACDLVRLNGESTHGVYFPFAGSAEGLQKMIADKKMTRASSEVISLIYKMKPYKKGNIALRGIHDLDIMDKHQAIIPAVSAAEAPPFTLKFQNSITGFPSIKTTILRDGQPLVMMPRIYNVVLGSIIPVRFSLVLDDATPFAGQEITETLKGLAQETTRVVEAFKVLCAGRQFPIVPPKPHAFTQALAITGAPGA